MEKPRIKIDQALMKMPAAEKKKLLNELSTLPKEKQKIILETPRLENETDQGYIERISYLASLGKTYEEYQEYLVREMNTGYKSPSSRASKIFMSAIAVVCVGCLGLGAWVALKGNGQINDESSDTQAQEQESEGISAEELKRLEEEAYKAVENSATNSSSSTSSSNYYQELLRQELERQAAKSSSSTQTYNVSNSTSALSSEEKDQIRAEAEAWTAQWKAEQQAQLQAEKQQWCDENMPSIFTKYDAQLAAEDARYESEVENYVASQYQAFAGSEAANRVWAEQTFWPIHDQYVKTIVNSYIQEAQLHDCDPFAYGSIDT